MKKRLISIILLIAMLFTSIPVEAMSFAGDNKDTATGIVQEKQFINPFTDVRDGSWYYDAVQYAHINGFFSGTSASTFAPDGTMNRSMFVTVLGRMAGMDQGSYKGQSSFTDVAADAYYAPFVAWASKHGITAGVGDGKFDPNGLINREQMAVFFIRYFETFGVSYDTGANIMTVPADLDSVSPWAQDAVLKLWKTGLLSGDGVNFNPEGNASRAQTATLCMRTDKSVKTWFREPGVPSDRVSIDPWAEQKPEKPVTPEKPETEDPSDGGSATTNYKITFVVDDSTKMDKLYPKDTLLSTMLNPAQPAGKVFLGWYHDIEKNRPVSGDDKLTGDITLYAKFTDAISMQDGGTLNFVSALEQAPNFSVALKSDIQPQIGTDFNFRDITAAEDEDIVDIEVKDSGNGVWTISASGGFTPGHTYQVELISDLVTYDDRADVFGDLKANNPLYDIAEVRFFNFSIDKNGTLNLKLNSEIKYIHANELDDEDAMRLMDYAGLYQASTNSEGITTYTANDGSGSFTYDGNQIIEVGDTIAIYKGDKPTERKPEKGNGSTNNDDVSYVKITAKSGNLYSYVAAEAEDVLFTPDILPIDIDNGDGTTGWSEDGTEVTVDNDKLSFSDSIYEKMGLSSDTTVDVGDFLAFYTGNFGQDDAQDIEFGEIKEIIVNGDITIIRYEVVSLDKVMSSMELYDETEPSNAEIEAIIEENKDEIQQIIEDQIVQGDFFDNVGKYLAKLTLETDEVREVFGNDMNLTNCTITYADGTPIAASDMSLFGNIVDKDAAGNKPKVDVSVTPRLAHFTQSSHGLRAEVSVTYNFEIQKKNSNNKIKVELTAFFEQEITFGFSVSGGAIWKWKWIFPYIADYRMNGNLDLGTYTGIGITATAKLVEEKEPWGMPWPNSVKEAQATKKIFSLSESIKKKMDELEEIFPEENGSASGGLADKYSKFMEDANKDWVDLITVKLLDLRGAVDPLHILAYGLRIDFVVSANLNVAIGMTFQYENFKRHSFTLLLKSKKSESETVDLSTNGYQFDFYVMGTIGLRAGIRAKATVGLFSTKLAGIGLQIEVGAYTRMWGYFYYHLENWKVRGVWQKNSSYSGAVLIEIGAYLDLKFIAEALNGKYSYAPTLFAKEWPLWSAGQRENVYDFAYADNPSYAIYNVNTYTLPAAVYDMHWMDLKTGEVKEGFEYKTKNFDSVKPTGSSHEERFSVELSNPNFSYNPVNNLITINTASGAVQQSSQMKLTWKGSPLSSSSDTISRTITLNWSNDKNTGTIAFESNGGSAVQMLRLLAGTSIIGKMPANPTKLGYTFSGWYTDKALNNLFTATTMPAGMPAGNTTLYAKWTPNIVRYTVEHYKKALDGQYELFETSQMTGVVNTQTVAVANTYTGFKAQTIKQQIIEADGSTKIAIYYDRNSYPLTFAYGTDGNDVTVNVPYESAIIKPSNPTKLGYTFIGWDVAIPNTMPADALIITAQWSAEQVGYKVKHIRQNTDKSYPTSGDLVETESLTGFTGQSTAAQAKTYTGFTAQAVTQKTILPDGSTIVEINYERNSYTVTFDGNGSDSGSMATQTFIYDIEQNLTTNSFTRTGYAFRGWNTKADGKGTSYVDEESVKNLSDMANETLTLYAQWELVVGTVTFDSNKGIGSTTPTTPSPATLTVTLGEEYGTLPTISRSGYVFSGWYTEASGGTLVTDTTMVMSIENHTLYAHWTPNNYTVNFNGNGSDEGSMATQSFIFDTAQYLTLNSFSRTDYIFDGWSTTADGSGISYAGGALVRNLTDMANGSVTLYAKWKSNKITVTFDSNKGSGSTIPSTSNPGSKIVTIGSSYDTLATVSRPGYTFAGWYTSAVGGTLVEDTTTVTSTVNHTLFARWTPISYTVNFDGNGSTDGSMTAQNFTFDVGQTLSINEFIKTEYKFVGWNTEANGSGISYTSEDLVINLSEVANDSITLYAQWTYINNVAEIGITGYKTLQDAFNAVTDGQIIKLLDNITLSAPVSLSKDLSFTLDLNGKTLDGGTEVAIMCYSGTLIITDSASGGKITSTMSHTYFKGTIYLGGTGNLVVAGGRVENTTTSEYLGPAIGINGKGSVSVTGGTVSANIIAIINDSTGTVSVSGGTVSSNKAAAIQNNSTGKITISGMAIITTAYESYYASAIILKAGTAEDTILEITGGTIESTYVTSIAISNNADGKISIPSGSPIIKGGRMAMNKAPDLSEYTDVYVTASINVDGSSPVAYDQDNITDYKYLKFEKIVTTDYKIRVSGVQVTSENAEDILGDGKVSYDAVNNILTLDNANISGSWSGDYTSSAAIYGADILTINLIGNNTVTNIGNGSNVFGIYVYRSLTITGSGTLTVSTEGATAVKQNFAIFAGLSGNFAYIENGVTVIARAGNVTNPDGKSYGIMMHHYEYNAYTIYLSGTLEAYGHTAALYASVRKNGSTQALSFTGVSLEYDGELESTEEEASAENCTKYKHIYIEVTNP